VFRIEVSSLSLFCKVGLRSLNLGICPKLNELRVEAPCMDLLELKGCGGLSEAAINCPRLTSLDASFCGLVCYDYLDGNFYLIDTCCLCH